MKLLSLVILLSLASSKTGCKYTPQPGSSLSDVVFVVYPHIVKSKDGYYLEYQINADSTILRRLLYSRSHEGKGYYFFSTPISNNAYSGLVKQYLKEVGFDTFAAQNEVYWLNEDKSVVKLRITQ